MAPGAPGGSAELGASTVLDAAREGNADALAIALARGGHANATSADGAHTALGITALRGHTDCTRLLLSARADVNLANAHGVAPLIECADVGYADCMRLLLHAGAAVNQMSTGGTTALIAAADAGRSDCLGMLLGFGASVDVDHLSEGHSALIAAAVEGSEQCVRLLLDAGADLHRKGQGRRALQWSQRKGHGACTKVLHQALAAKGIRVRLDTEAFDPPPLPTWHVGPGDGPCTPGPTANRRHHASPSGARGARESKDASFGEASKEGTHRSDTSFARRSARRSPAAERGRGVGASGGKPKKKHRERPSQVLPLGAQLSDAGTSGGEGGAGPAPSGRGGPTPAARSASDEALLAAIRTGELGAIKREIDRARDTASREVLAQARRARADAYRQRKAARGAS